MFSGRSSTSSEAGEPTAETATESETETEQVNDTLPDSQELPENTQQPNPAQEQLPAENSEPPVEGSGQFTLVELTEKLESQQSEARRLENKAAFVENDNARRFALSALLRVGKKLQEVRSSTSISAAELLTTVEAVDTLLKNSSEALGE